MKAKLKETLSFRGRPSGYSCISVSGAFAFALVLLLWSCGKKEEPSPLRQNEKTVINTRPPGFVATDSVKLSAEVLEVSQATIQEGGFILSQNPAPTAENSTFYRLTNIEKTGPYSFVVKGLKANHKYYYRFYVKENEQVLYGTTQAFTTTGISITSIRYLSSTEADDYYEGGVGNQIMIEGTNFSKIPSENVVRIGNTEAKVISSFPYHDHELNGSIAIMLEIPDTVPPGLHEVTVTRSQQTVAAPQALRILPGQWKQLQDLNTGLRSPAYSFAINGKGYLAGMLPYLPRSIYEYTQGTDSWSKLTNVKIDEELEEVFVLNGKAYFGVGHRNYAQMRYDLQLYSYDPATGLQEQKEQLAASYPYINTTATLTAFAIEGHGYMGGGSYTINSNWERVYSKSFYKYSPAADSWTPIADFPGTSTADAVTFVINGIAYLMVASHEYKILSEVWAYNPVANTWSRKRDFPGQLKTGMKGVAIGSKGYLMGGTINSIYQPLPGKRDFWEYDPASDTWREFANFDNGAWQSLSCFVIGNKAYAVINESYDRSSVWEFTPAQ